MYAAMTKDKGNAAGGRFSAACQWIPVFTGITDKGLFNFNPQNLLTLLGHLDPLVNPVPHHPGNHLS